MGKVPGHQRKMCSHKDSVPSLVPEFWRGYQEKRCVRIGARRRIEPGHGARARCPGTKCEHCYRYGLVNVLIKTECFYADIASDAESNFDTSNFLKDDRTYFTENKKVIVVM